MPSRCQQITNIRTVYMVLLSKFKKGGIQITNRSHSASSTFRNPQWADSEA